MRNDPELSQIVERAKNLNQEALALIYERYFDRIYRYALFRVCDRYAAEDLAGQTFLRLVERIGDFQWRNSGFNSWLFRIAHNLIIDWFRDSRETTVEKLPEIESAVGESAEKIVLADETLREALAAVNELNDIQRQVILLRLVAGLSCRETAEALDISAANARTLQHRALATVRDKLRVKIDV